MTFRPKVQSIILSENSAVFLSEAWAIVFVPFDQTLEKTQPQNYFLEEEYSTEEMEGSIRQQPSTCNLSNCTESVYALCVSELGQNPGLFWMVEKFYHSAMSQISLSLF